MTQHDGERELSREEEAQVRGGTDFPGVYRPGLYRDAALDFFRSCVGSETFNRAMGSEYGHRHHYVAARAFLNQADWERFVWVEQHGSLEGFPE